MFISNFPLTKNFVVVTHKNNNLEVDFEWKRHRLFDKLACEVLYDKCKESSAAKIEKVEKKPKLKWRPKPLDTVVCKSLISLLVKKKKC